jgi:predicted DNA-binding transcriptional regulator AlpA
MAELAKKTDDQMIVTLTVAELRAVVREELKANGNGREPDRLLDAEEAAGFLSVSPEWLYKNWPKLPFAVKLHHRMLRFSHAGIQRYIASKRS